MSEREFEDGAYYPVSADFLNRAADAIERGEHLKLG
jgi:hypothetical protein